MNKSTAELKSEAKGILLGKYKTVIAATILIQLITLTVSFLITYIVPTTSVAGFIMYYAVTFIVELLCSILTVGQIYLNLNIICDRPYKISDVFYGFKAHPDKAIAIQFLLFLFSFICLIPAAVAFVFYSISRNPILIMLIAVLGVIGGIVAVIIQLQYSQAFYLLLDFPEYSSLELLAQSKLLMKGHCIHLFYLYISFIPLTLLGALSFGIGLLFITPYMNMTFAFFYLDLIHSRQNQPVSDLVDQPQSDYDVSAY